MIRRLAPAIAMLCLRALAQEPACVIGGTVVDSSNGRPMVHARVMVSGRYSLVKLTDEHGAFCFDVLDKGEHRVQVHKAGYAEFVHGVMLAVEENSAIKPLVIRMTRHATLSGTVLDDSGDTVPGATVTIWDRVRGKTGWGPEQVDSTKADVHGAFRFSQLEPGTYYLSVGQSDELSHPFIVPFVDSNGQPPVEKEVETFYAGSFTFNGATPVELDAGQQVNNVVLALKKARLRRVTGRIANSARSGYLTYDAESETGNPINGAIPVANDGSFVALGLPPARYTLRLTVSRRIVAQKEVDLTAGDALGVTLEPVETMDVPVTFRTEGKGPAFRPRSPRSAGSILVQDGSEEAVGLDAAGDGTFRFAAVPRGVYRLQLDMAGQPLYLKSVTYGGETQTGNKVDLRSARQGGLELTFSAKVATVQGRAVPPSGGADGEQNADLTVILVSANPGDEASIAQHAGTDQKGRFAMRTVPPGKYRLFAIEGFDGEEWGRPELMRALADKAVEFELRENEKKQVSVTIISADEWEAAAKKIGD